MSVSMPMRCTSLAAAVATACLSASCAKTQIRSARAESNTAASSVATTAAGTTTAGAMPVAQAVKAANDFLATLTPQQTSAVSFAFTDDAQRRRWSNLPSGIFQRAGIKLGDLSATQKTAAWNLLASVLSKKGYTKIQQIVEADEVLKQTDNGPPGQPAGSGGPGRRRGPGGQLLFGRDLYFISILGTPSTSTPWMLQFGGHHLGLNVTIAGNRGILTPTLTGAQPATYTVNGQTVRPLGSESDKAVALLNSLDANQKKQAILSYNLADLVLGPGQDDKTIQPEGLKASAMSDNQRAMLLDIVSEWSGIVHESEADQRMAEIKAGINDTYFAWSGPTDVTVGKNIASYYRIQGPQLVIEYAPQTLGGDASNHIHTMYRDPTNDYAKRLAAR